MCPLKRLETKFLLEKAMIMPKYLLGIRFYEFFLWVSFIGCPDKGGASNNKYSAGMKQVGDLINPYRGIAIDKLVVNNHLIEDVTPEEVIELSLIIRSFGLFASDNRY